MNDINISLTNSEIKYKPISKYIKISRNEVKIKTGNKKIEKILYNLWNINNSTYILFI